MPRYLPPSRKRICHTWQGRGKMFRWFPCAFPERADGLEAREHACALGGGRALRSGTFSNGKVTPYAWALPVARGASSGMFAFGWRIGRCSSLAEGLADLSSATPMRTLYFVGVSSCSWRPTRMAGPGWRRGEPNAAPNFRPSPPLSGLSCRGHVLSVCLCRPHGVHDTAASHGQAHAPIGPPCSSCHDDMIVGNQCKKTSTHNRTQRRA